MLLTPASTLRLTARRSGASRASAARTRLAIVAASSPSRDVSGPVGARRMIPVPGDEIGPGGRGAHSLPPLSSFRDIHWTRTTLCLMESGWTLALGFRNSLHEQSSLTL